MHRRSVLVGLATLSAGCVGGSSQQQFVDAFESYLSSSEVTVRSVEQTDNTVQLRYVPTGTEYEELSAEIGTISGGFIREIENGWGVNRLNADLVSEEDQELAEWHIKSEWIEEYRDGQLSPNQFSLRIIETVEFTNR